MSEKIPIANSINYVHVEELNERTYKNLVPYTSDMKTTKTFLLAAIDMILRYITELNEHDSPVIKNGLRTPAEYLKMFTFEIDDQGSDLYDILANCELILETTVRSGHPRFINQLSQGVDTISLVGEMITSTINANMFTYEVAPVFNLMEESVLTHMRDCCGWPTQEPLSKNGDGVLAPGGALSNLYAVLAAKHYAFPQIKKGGIRDGLRPAMVISKHCHYSMKRAAAILSIGTDQVYEVDPDESGRVTAENIEEKILYCQSLGLSVFFVAITAGTTVFGAFDPIEEVSVICRKYKVWLHVDGAWGGSTLLSPKTKHLLQGIDKADSFTWNPHKLMSIHLQCSAILIRHLNVLKEANQMCAGYLFQPDKHYETSLDTGDKTIQCGRHVDILKLWLGWKARGHLGYAQHVEGLVENAKFFYETLLKREPYFRMVMKPPFINVCFWYVPSSLQHYDRTTLEYKQQLDKVAPKIKERMMNSGTMMIGYQRLDDYPNFFRAIISNPATTKGDIVAMIDEIHELGHDL
ncbi:unnamed protein product [Rotaria magnacalcarata]|uniref:Glutamate decarboxylase n=1 Tax=Rotaria magnacalcarata TaxID=392030 RepID=A0A819PW25_9BILA|nr:unnamed protein product [Rotaria magnacalcarata]CAF2265080.1 unnamed protein product [Rotaria magnacalcarata]CAF4019296.1 unnamed protein product [Rotaria magnacalcarata]CAF4124745.1 unnamed protein product [Rotaria magnacalcarata]